MIGATQNSHSCPSAQPPTNTADARAARRIHRGVRHRDADQVDQGQAQADGDRREALRRALVGGAQDDEQEHHGHDDLA